MAKPHERAIALVLALLFFGTSVATGAAVLWQIQQDKKQSSTTMDDIPEEVRQQLEAQQKTQEASETNKTEGNKLEGTKLADFTPREKVEQLESIDLVVGTGDEVKAGATITAHYTGALVKDGTIFQSSHDMGQPATFGLDQVIKGWTEGVPGMKVGGKRRLIIPAAQAYGEQSPSANIPANSDLVFDIELVSIQQ